MGESRVIKRYANRKLYDTQRSKYVTLEQIADMIRDGDDVKIVDNNSKEDLTTITLAQIIFEEEKRQKSFLPISAMKGIIASGGERIEELVSQAQKRVQEVFRRKNDETGETAEPLDLPPPETAVETSKEGGARALRELREWLENSRSNAQEWQRRVDERVRHVVEGISPWSSIQKEVGALAARIGELEEKLEKVAAAEKAAQDEEDAAQ